MATLFLLRHTKSSWDDPSITDHDRPLAARGIKAAKRIGDYMARESIRPDLVWCSSARRAVGTLSALSPGFGPTTQVKVVSWLYGASSKRILEHLNAVDPQVRSTMVIGHNPEIQSLAIVLAATGDPAAIGQLHAKYPTGALATVDFEGVDWSRLAPGGGNLTSFVLPRQLA